MSSDNPTNPDLGRPTLLHAESKRKMAVRMAAENKSPEEIAEALGISIIVAKIWSDADIRRGPENRRADSKSPPVSPIVKEMRAMRDAGMLDVEIAKHFGISKQAVNQRLGRRTDQKPKSDSFICLRIRKKSYKRCIEIAASLGCMGNIGVNAKSGSVAHLLEKIADGELSVVKTRFLEL